MSLAFSADNYGRSGGDHPIDLGTASLSVLGGGTRIERRVETLSTREEWGGRGGGEGGWGGEEGTVENEQGREVHVDAFPRGLAVLLTIISGERLKRCARDEKAPATQESAAGGLLLLSLASLPKAPFPPRAHSLIRRMRTHV